MSGAPTPVFMPEAFAVNASGSFRNTIPDTTVSTQLASWSLGFPPLTMTPIVSGGKPPFGQDFNGVLYALSTHAFYAQAGELPLYSALVSAAISGYALGTLLGSTDGTTVWFNILDGNTSDPDASGAGWVPLFSYGISPVSGLTGGVVTLSRAAARRPVLVLSGALVGNLTIVLPNDLRRWLIVNTTTGVFTTTVRTAAGTGVAVAQGGFSAPVEVYGDGTNLYPTVAPLTIPTDVAPTPNTYPLRSNAGYIFATYFNQNSALENLSLDALFFETAGDGYLRKISQANARLQLFVDAALTGVPTAPTPTAGDNTTKIATTAFVQAAAASLNGGGYVDATGSASSILPAGWSVSHVSTGRYRLTFNFTLATSVHGVAITASPILAGSDDRYCNILVPTTTTVDIEVVDTGAGNVDNALYFTYSRIAA